MSQILWTTTVAQLLQRKGQKPFLQLDKLTTLDTALTKLKQENQRFAAVFDDLSNAATYLGTVDMFDIISFILAFYRKEEVVSKTRSYLLRFVKVETRIGVLTIEEWNTDIRTLTKDNEIFKNTTLDYVIGNVNHRSILYQFRTCQEEPQANVNNFLCTLHCLRRRFPRFGHQSICIRARTLLFASGS